MSNIENLTSFDPFADAVRGTEDGVQDGLVHIRIQQRNGRKTLTTVQGLSDEYDLKKIIRAASASTSASCLSPAGSPSRSNSKCTASRGSANTKTQTHFFSLLAQLIIT